MPLGIYYLKADPTSYILHYSNGRVVREGAGRSFFYLGPSSTIVSVPLASTDVPFAFTEVSADFQTITVQGQLTYRIVEPKKVAGLLNFAVGANGRHLSDDPQKLGARLVVATQEKTRSMTQKLPLREALVSSETIAAGVVEALRASEVVTSLGVEIMGLTIVRIAPTPEMAKALEAETREATQRAADMAIFDRRNSAVEQERRIKESELATEVMVEHKKRQIRETQIAADIAIEEQRAKLMEQQIANDRAAAEARAFALESTLKPLRETDWRTLMAANANGMDARSLIALAFHDLAGNADKIGELNISPDLLRSIMDGKK